jgi:hypothetical protein
MAVMGQMGDVLSQALQGRVGAILPLNRSVDGGMKYRPEIDGLRAVAVSSVVLFHLGDKVVSGGYVGVDVFFVISGYLITSLICSERGLAARKCYVQPRCALTRESAAAAFTLIYLRRQVHSVSREVTCAR